MSQFIICQVLKQYLLILELEVIEMTMVKLTLSKKFLLKVIY